MKNINQVTLIGRLGQKPEVRSFANGGLIANFNLAVSDDYRDKNGNNVERTHWINIVVNGKLVEIAERYLNKGSKICVTGKLVQEQYQDKQGQNRSVLKVYALGFEMLDSKPASQSTNKNAESSQTEEFDDSIPF